MNQTEGTDATSKFQDSLPVSSDMLLKQLANWQIEYQRFDHVPLRTVEESKKVQSLFRSWAQGGGHIKNLYLRDHKKRNILLVAEQDRQIDLKSLSRQLGTGRLSFGSADHLLTYLGVRPGAVTPLSMITGVKNSVSLFIDRDLRSCSQIYAHPLVNDRTIALSVANLELFFRTIRVEPVWVDLSPP